MTFKLFGQEDSFINFIEKQEISKIDSIIKSGFDINKKYDFSNTGLHYAVKTGNLDLVKYFVINGANINAIHINNGTPLMIATEEGYFEIIKFLVNNGANINLKNANGYSLVHNIPISENIEILKYFINLNININDTANDSWTIMITAAGDNKNLNYFKYLVDTLHLNIFDKTNWGYSVFLASISNKSKEITKYLLEHGASPNDKDENGQTALMYAAESNENDIVLLLLENGADKNAVTTNLDENLKVIDYAKDPQIKTLINNWK